MSLAEQIALGLVLLVTVPLLLLILLVAVPLLLLIASRAVRGRREAFPPGEDDPDQPGTLHRGGGWISGHGQLPPAVVTDATGTSAYPEFYVPMHHEGDQ